MSAIVLFLAALSSSTLTALIYISVSHTMMKRPTHPLWQNAWISNYLPAGLARVFVWLPTGFSVYLHIWLAVSCLLAVHVLVSSCGLPCNHVSLCFSLHFYVCLPTCPPLRLPVCWALCRATHRDWHLTMQQEWVKEVGYGLLWRSLKHDWQDNSFGGITAAERQWQLLPTHSHCLAKKGGRGHTGLLP